ncbi:MAG: alpha/beta hydrolase [Eubacteriales bacterium]|nr:alpha/beta hydrolase [Eubacteriales bacterium]
MDRYYTFELNDMVNRTSVTYKNRYGITLAGDLYMAKGLDMDVRHPALVIGPPYGGVKEQGPGVYANQLAQRGFVVLAFDPSYNGESGGSPRHISSPEVFAEDFSAGVDYLGTRKEVDRERIGAIGICGSGGFALCAAQVDKRIKAVATVSMYDISAMRNAMKAEQLDATLTKLSIQRWVDYEKGEMDYLPSFPETPAESVPNGLDPIAAEFYSYYGLKRGHHPNARGAFTTTSQMAFFNFQLLNHIDAISPRPILFVMGENAHSRFFSENAYAAAAEPKELYVVPDAIHIDLYDRVDKIPFQKLTDFFTEAFQSSQL